MQPSDLPEWFLDIQRSKQGMMFGRIPLELVVAQEKITKVIGTKSLQTKFRNTNEGQIFMLDHVRTKLKDAGEATDPSKSDGAITFTIMHKGEKITQINTFDTVEYNYPM
jgi:hypothetical protein